LAVYIWRINSEGLVPDARQIADGASAVLILAVLAFNLAARFFGRLLGRKFSGSKAAK
jgi:phosphate transport system permease protein